MKACERISTVALVRAVALICVVVVLLLLVDRSSIPALTGGTLLSAQLYELSILVGAATLANIYLRTRWSRMAWFNFR